jgi:hypothetical protein
MTFSQLSPAAASGCCPERLVLLAHGCADQVLALQRLAGPRLAKALDLHWAGFPDAADPADPDALLTDLPGGLVSLPLDPGQTLTAGGHWAEVLGAWRQPALVLVTAVQAASGVPAASAALLRQQGVPLVGLVQWGGPWEAERRRREGLPWLGWLTADGQPDTAALDDQAAALAAAVRLRWRG